MPHQVGGLLRLLQCGRCCSTMLAAGICPYGNNGVVANAAAVRLPEVHASAIQQQAF